MADTFSSFFERIGEREWRVRGSGVNDAPDTAPRTARVCKALEELGFDVTPDFIPSMGGADQYDLGVPFLDGGFSATTGNFIGASKCAVVRGRKAVALVTEMLRLQLPSFVAHRQGVPQGGSLRAEVKLWKRLMPLYEKASVEVRHPGEPRLVLMPGERNEALDRRLPLNGQWAVLMAGNPRADLDAAASAQLREALVAEGRSAFEAVTRLRDWAQPSFFVAGIEEDDAVRVAACFGQRAVLLGRAGEPARLRWA